MQGKVIFSYEESYGYMLGDYVRDKDAVSASVELTEMAAWYACQGMTLYDALQALFKKYGYYGEQHHEPGHARPGRAEEDGRPDGRPAGAAPGGDRRCGGEAAEGLQGRQRGGRQRPAPGLTMELTGSNVLRYEMADGTSLIVRPSGTEPKVKVYILANGADKEECDGKVAKYAAWAESLKD